MKRTRPGTCKIRRSTLESTKQITMSTISSSDIILRVSKLLGSLSGTKLAIYFCLHTNSNNVCALTGTELAFHKKTSFTIKRRNFWKRARSKTSHCSQIRLMSTSGPKYTTIFQTRWRLLMAPGVKWCKQIKQFELTRTLMREVFLIRSPIGAHDLCWKQTLLICSTKINTRS